MKAIDNECISFFYPGGWWGGWAGFFEPNIPSRLMLHGTILLNEAFYSGNFDLIIDFLQTSHVKYLSRLGRGESDVLCRPTEKARTAVKFLRSYNERVVYESD